VLIRRSDAAVLNAPVRTSAGTTYTARVASDGPLKYLAADGSVQIERRSIDVLKSIVDQLPGIELTVDHPDGMLRPGDGVRRVGVVRSARLERDGDVTHAVAELHITDQGAIGAIANGRRGISLGYLADVEGPAADGSYEQLNCQVNHAAIVETPRCTSCFMRADHAGACRTDVHQWTDHDRLREHALHIGRGGAPNKQDVDAMRDALRERGHDVLCSDERAAGRYLSAVHHDHPNFQAWLDEFVAPDDDDDDDNGGFCDSDCRTSPDDDPWFSQPENDMSKKSDCACHGQCNCDAYDAIGNPTRATVGRRADAQLGTPSTMRLHRDQRSGAGQQIDPEDHAVREGRNGTAVVRSPGEMPQIVTVAQVRAAVNAWGSYDKPIRDQLAEKLPAKMMELGMGAQLIANFRKMVATPDLSSEYESESAFARAAAKGDVTKLPQRGRSRSDALNADYTAGAMTRSKRSK
jgi:hypothetical protein